MSKKLEASPLYYWEEKSYMMAIPAKEDENLLKVALANLEKFHEVNVIKQEFKPLENAFYINLEYEKEEYEIGLYIGGVNVPFYYLNGIQFTQEEKEDLQNAKQALTIFMKFNDNIKKCYHLQLKLAVNLVPDLIGLLDESAEKMHCRKWALLNSSSKVLPSFRDLYSVQAIASKKKQIWLHTHGLCRCHMTELEVLDSSQDKQQNHFNLLNAYAMYLLDHKDENPFYKGVYIGRLSNNFPIVVTCLPWTESLLEYHKLQVGGKEDRKAGHNSETSIIFSYQSEEDEKEQKVSKINIYDDYINDNPLFFFSDEETFRMKALALERIAYVSKAFANKENTIILKIGLPLEEEGKFEHIWFELLEIKDGKYKAKLTQEPYFINDIHEGYEAWYEQKDITDWLIYTPKYSINPDNVFLLDE